MITAPSVLTIELVGSYIAVHLESGTTDDQTAKRDRATTKSPIPILARKLVAAGYDPQARVHVVRKAFSDDHLMPVFKRDRTLLTWSAVDVIEDVSKGPREVKHRPYSGPTQSNVTIVAQLAQNAQDVEEGGEDTSQHAMAINAAPGTQKNTDPFEKETR